MRLAAFRNECLTRGMGWVEMRFCFLSTEHPVQFGIGPRSLISCRPSGCWGGFPRRLSFWRGLVDWLHSGGRFHGFWHLRSELWRSGSWSSIETASCCGRRRWIGLRWDSPLLLICHPIFTGTGTTASAKSLVVALRCSLDCRSKPWLVRRITWFILGPRPWGNGCQYWKHKAGISHRGLR